MSHQPLSFSGAAAEKKSSPCPLWVADAEAGPRLDQQLREAAALLAANQVVGFPTETVYGLGGNAFSDEAIVRIFRAKGRPSDNPLIVHIADRAALGDLVAEITPSAQKLIDTFWPGPLTVVLKAKDCISRKCTGGVCDVMCVV